MIRAWLLAAALALLAGAYGWGRMDGARLAHAAQAATVAAAQAATIRAAEVASRKEAERLALQAERDALAHQLEDEAREDPDATGGLPAGRVDRLRRR